MTENHKILQSKYPSIKKLKWQKTVPFTKGIKYLEIHLTKEVKDLYSENYKTLMRETEDDTKEMERHPEFLNWKN